MTEGGVEEKVRNLPNEIADEWWSKDKEPNCLEQ